MGDITVVVSDEHRLLCLVELDMLREREELAEQLYILLVWPYGHRGGVDDVLRERLGDPLLHQVRHSMGLRVCRLDGKRALYKPEGWDRGRTGRVVLRETVSPKESIYPVIDQVQQDLGEDQHTHLCDKHPDLASGVIYQNRISLPIVSLLDSDLGVPTIQNVLPQGTLHCLLESPKACVVHVLIVPHHTTIGSRVL